MTEYELCELCSNEMPDGFCECDPDALVGQAGYWKDRAERAEATLVIAERASAADMEFRMIDGEPYVYNTDGNCLVFMKQSIPANVWHPVGEPRE